MNITLTEDELELILDGLNYCMMDALSSKATARIVRLKEKLRAANDSYDEKPDAFDDSDDIAGYRGFK